jgi:uncharacterized protein (DUF302 family)
MAQMSDYVYAVDTEKTFDQALVAVRRAAEARKWGVLGDYDFNEILASKGFPQDESVKALDICNPGFANAFMGAERLTALCMPCSVLVFTENGRTKIGTLQPSTMMPLIFPEAAPQAEAHLDQVTADVRAIVDEAAG